MEKRIILKIYEETETIEEPLPEVTLKLKRGRNGCVDVVACDGNGARVLHGSLVSFHEDGTLILHAKINNEIGFKTNKSGQLITRPWKAGD